MARYVRLACKLYLIAVPTKRCFNRHTCHRKRCFIYALMSVVSEASRVFPMIIERLWFGEEYFQCSWWRWQIHAPTSMKQSWLKENLSRPLWVPSSSYMLCDRHPLHPRSPCHVNQEAEAPRLLWGSGRLWPSPATDRICGILRKPASFWPSDDKYWHFPAQPTTLVGTRLFARWYSSRSS